jgi:hypothetical protein
MSVATSNVVTLEAPTPPLKLLTSSEPWHTAHNKSATSGEGWEIEAIVRNTGSVFSAAIAPRRRIRACSLSRSTRTRRIIETAKLWGQPWSIILRPFNSAKASYSENKISAPVPGASSLKNAKLASSGSFDRTLRPIERSSSRRRLIRVRNSEGGFWESGSNMRAIRLFDLIAFV